MVIHESQTDEIYYFYHLISFLPLPHLFDILNSFMIANSKIIES